MKRKRLLRSLLCLAMLLALCLTMVSCAAPEEETPVQLDTEPEDTNKIDSLDQLIDSAEDILKDNEDLVEDAMDYLASREDLKEKFSEVLDTLASETEGMTRDEAIEYWLRKALSFVEDKVPEEQRQQIQDALDQLYAAGYLMEQALYDTENLLFTFIQDSGILGGVHLKEQSRVLNNAPTGNRYEQDLIQPSLVPNGMQVLVLNGFEDMPYRTDYYQALYEDWTAQGIGITLDNEVTVADLAALDPYDAIVFSMHGSTYLDQPILALDEVPTLESDIAYSQYLYQDNSVAKVMYVDGTCGYWVLPSFFSNQYAADGLDGKIIFSESCCFFGCNCYTADFDTTLAQAMLDSSAEAVMGYYNSVSADYSRNIMRLTMECMYGGMPAYDAICEAAGIYGENDGWVDPAEDKFLSCPVFTGDKLALMEQPEQPPEQVPEQQPEQTPAGEDMANLDTAIEIIEADLYEHLIGVYAQSRQDGTFYLPYHNLTGYSFRLSIDLEYFYKGDVVFEDGSYVYDLEPGDYIEIPADFPYNCDAWNLWFTFSDISYKGVRLG